MTRDTETNELPTQAGRDPTLPLPREGAPQVERRRRWPFPSPFGGARPWLAVAGAAALAASSFALGWTLGDGPDSGPRDRPASVAAPLPDADALYCGRALDAAAQVIDVYRDGMENRIAFTDAVLDEDTARMAELESELPELTRRADRLEQRVTRALATCPS